VAPASATCDCDISSTRRSEETVVRSAWVKVCRPTSDPESTTCRTTSGYRTMFDPTVKNVPWTPWRWSTARIAGVHAGSGPSSKVRATVLRGRAEEIVLLPVGSITEPPSAMVSGTASALPVGRAPVSETISALANPLIASMQASTSVVMTARIARGARCRPATRVRELIRHPPHRRRRY
jgi:hypothetical protein